MTVRALSDELLDDWLDFFENRAFEDNDEWRGCYLTACFYPKPEEYRNQSKRRKDYAIWLVKTGRMGGYMAYEEGKVVGWVNSNNRDQFPRFRGADRSDEAVLSIVCFIVEKPYRGRGIAKSMLASIVEDAKGKGYSVIEAYPKRGAKSEYGRWNGPFEMYKSAGFVEHERDKMKVVRKYL